MPSQFVIARARRLVATSVAVAGLVVAAAGCGGSGSVPTSGAGAASGTVTALPAVDDKHIDPLPAVPTPALPVTITGADGTRVLVRDARRIIPLTGGIAEIVFTLGLGKNVVARDVSTTFSAAAKLPVVTRAHDVSAESVLSLHPSVVIADTDTGPKEAVTQIRAAGIPVVLLAPAVSVGEVVPRIHAVAAALGVPTAGDQLANRTQLQLTAAGAVPADGRPLKVAFLYLRGTAGVYLIGGNGSGADSLIEAAGGTDAGTGLGLGPFTPITSESLIAAAPDVLLLMTDGLESVGGLRGLEKIPGIAQTPAGENRRVITIEDGVLLNFGPRTAQVISALAGALAAMK
jgi:iron complex transport system substrate-binding protein